MYLISTINYEECGYQIIAKGSKQECQEALDSLIKRVWYNEDGSQKYFSDIYDDTLAKNARIITNKQAVKEFGGKYNLELAIECMYN